MNDVTQILKAIEDGDPHAAEQLLPLVYDELRRLAAQKLAVNISAAATSSATEAEPANDDWVPTFLAPPRDPDSLGRLNHYEVLEVVGHGGMGVVLKSRDTKLERIVAVKVLAPQLAASGPARKRFVREAKAAAAVRDEHVIDIHEVNDGGAIPYLAMEYIGGVTLEDRINSAKGVGSTLSKSGRLSSPRRARRAQSSQQNHAFCLPCAPGAPAVR